MTKQRLVDDIERACSILRSDSNCSGVRDYVEHLSWLLFLKFLDSRYQAGEIDESKPRHQLDPAYRWSEWVPKFLSQKEPYNDNKRTEGSSNLISFIRQELLPYLSSLSGSSEFDLIASLFKDHDVVVCSSFDSLKEVIRIVDRINFEQKDELQRVASFYEALLKRLGQENGSIGEFYTPRAVVQSIVEATNPRLGESVYDPCCGSGAILAATYNHLKTQIQSNESTKALEQTPVVGNIKNASPSLYGTLNMLLSGATEVHISQKNVLEEPIGDTGQFDIIVTNPPFGGRESERTQRNFRVKSSASELLYLQYIMSKLSFRTGSRCSIIVPEGVLFRRESSFRSVKKELLENFNLLMVMSLPRGVFAPYSTMVKTSVLFFERPGPTKEVLYYEVSPYEGGKALFNSSSTFEKCLHEVTDLYKQWQAYQAGKGSPPQPTPICWIETVETLVARDYDLSAQNPHKPDNEHLKLPSPAEITAALITWHCEFTQILQHLHEIVSEYEDK